MASMTRFLPSIRTWFTSLDRQNRSVVIAYLMILVLITFGTLFVSPNFDSPTFLIQQLRQASFLGIIAAGQMVVILTGNIDLSISWTLNLAAVVATAVAAGQNQQFVPSLLVGLGIGAGVGLINGFGVAYLRIPSMVLTLGMNALLKGITVAYTGSAPQFQKTPEIMSQAATLVIGDIIPVAVLIWAVISVINYVVLHRTTFGRKTYAVGNNEVATYL